jgi:hypothetical protein
MQHPRYTLTTPGLAAPDLGVGRDSGWKAAGLARAGAGEGWKRSDLAAPGLAAPDLGVGRDSGWKAAGLARASTREGWRRSDLTAPGLAATDRGAGHDSEWRRGKGWSVVPPRHATGGARAAWAGGEHTAWAEARRVRGAGALLVHRRIASDGTKTAVREGG